MVVFLPGFISLVGFGYDGGQMFEARRKSVNVATAAARVGATEVNEGSYRWNQRVRLNPAAAETYATDFAIASGASTVDVAIVEFPDYVSPSARSRLLLQDVDTVVVTVGIEVELAFLDLFMDNPIVEGTGRARATHPEELGL